MYLLRPIKTFLWSFFLLFFFTTVQADIVLQDLHGKRMAFSELNGKWVFINYWASWCQPCLDEIPELNRFYQKYKKANVAMFGVNYDALPPAQQKHLVKQFNIQYPTLKRDPAHQLHLGDIQGVPVTFVFNPEGHLKASLYGGQTVKSLSRVMTSGH